MKAAVATAMSRAKLLLSNAILVGLPLLREWWPPLCSLPLVAWNFFTAGWWVAAALVALVLGAQSLAFTLVLAAFVNFLNDAVSQVVVDVYSVVRSKAGFDARKLHARAASPRVKAVVRALCSVATGMAVLKGMHYPWPFFESLSSRDWVIRHAAEAADFKQTPLADLKMSAYLISMAPNAYRTELEESLVRFGMPAEKISIVPALNGAKCEAARKDYLRPTTDAVLNGLAASVDCLLYTGKDRPNFCLEDMYPKYEVLECSASEEHSHTILEASNGGASVVHRRAKKANSALFINTTRTFLTRPAALREVAVAASHLRAIKAAFDSGDEIALIFEDDASAALVPHWGDVGLAQVIDALPDDWHVLQLHVYLGISNGAAARNVDIMRRALARGQLASKRNLVEHVDFWGAVAYAVSREGMKALLDAHWQDDFVIPTHDAVGPILDMTEGGISDFMVYALPNTYFANRPLFSHQLGTGPHTSSIHASHLNAHEMDRRRALRYFYDTGEPNYERIDAAFWRWLDFGSVGVPDAAADCDEELFFVGGLKRLYFVVIPGLAILSVVLPLVGTSVFLILPVRSRDVELPECKEV